MSTGRALKLDNIFSLERAFIIPEKGFVFAKTYEINKRENLNILCPSI